MNDRNSIDQIALQVQNNLFQYFYYHNKVYFEGSFCSPRDFTARTNSPHNQQPQYQLINDQSSQPLHGSNTVFQKGIKTQMKVI